MRIEDEFPHWLVHKIAAKMRNKHYRIPAGYSKRVFLDRTWGKCCVANMNKTQRDLYLYRDNIRDLWQWALYAQKQKYDNRYDIYKAWYNVRSTLIVLYCKSSG